MNNARWCDAVCRAHGNPGRFLLHSWVNAQPVPRFYPNVVTLQPGKVVLAEQRETIDILLKSNLPGRWSVKDSFRTLDLSREGFEVLLEARWIRNVMPLADPSSDIVWQRETTGAAGLPFDDPDFAMFTGRRGFRVVAGGMFYRAEGVVGLSNVVADAADARTVWRALALLAAQTFPRLPLVGYESGDELNAARDAGFEVGDKLRIWVKSKE
ncbi:MAG: hypothetical protein EBY18_03440 [Alphaproteobacteria bacterium]|nr:hypothetical protein [Alphaproteobacteria bacterium]